MLEVRELRFAYSRRAEPVLRGLSLSLADGEVGIVLGRNGSGKTTLFSNILGINSPSSGSITFDGTDVLKLPRRERAKMIAYVPQDIRFGALTVFDSVLMGRVARFGLTAGEKDREETRRVLEDVGLTELAERTVTELSGGERQKVAIARALAQEPRLLVLDEPTGNLDIANERLILEEARKLARSRGIGVLSSLHDLNRALGFGDRLFFIKDGIVKYDCRRGDVTADMINDVFGGRVRMIDFEGEKIVIDEKITEEEK